MKLFLLLTYFIAIIILGCKHKEAISIVSGNYYTCSMHPQVHSGVPGKCPICSMDLIVVNINPTLKENEIQLSDEQVRLANISYDTIKSHSLADETLLTGKVVNDEKNNHVIPSRIAGRITKMYFRNVGDFVNKGDRLYEIYSEEINNAKQEYLLLLDKKKTIGNSSINFDDLLKTIRYKLILWGISNSQLNELERTRNASISSSVYSNESGFIASIITQEGGYVTEGQPVYTLKNISAVWVEAQTYTSEIASIHKGDKVKVIIPNLSNETIAGNIERIDPEINSQNRLNIIRVTVANPDNVLKPGMLAYIKTSSKISNIITIPVESTIENNHMQLVWVKEEGNIFTYRMVTTGKSNLNDVEILNGLKEGDIIVVSGAYLLNSEYKTRNGGSPMAGMKM